MSSCVARGTAPGDRAGEARDRAHATHALEHGAPIHLVQATLDHASVATTGRSLHA